MTIELFEDWKPVPEFPHYEISNFGRILNTNYGRHKKPTLNREENANVLFVDEHGRQHRRSLPLLVATLFLPPPEREDFDTPIHLDNDPLNNAVVNLAWRPRWFALRYARQFNKPLPYPEFQIQDSVTWQTFDNIRECAMFYGLLEEDIFHSVHNSVPVFPTWTKLQLVMQY